MCLCFEGGILVGNFEMGVLLRRRCRPSRVSRIAYSYSYNNVLSSRRPKFQMRGHECPLIFVLHHVSMKIPSIPKNSS